ncbi:MAG: shikimate dehydrogenase, partial [Clostridia bacterium]|nr:shikimate dehydrogenase [Clostridia bacterium]
MNKYCVIGEQLAHTLSPQIHKLFFENKGEIGEYGVREFAKSEILDAKSELIKYNGFNVTIPYKQTVMSFLDDISDEAKVIGAVNTVKNIDGKLYGYNTDPYGFSALLSVNGIDPCGKSAVVLGSGGAAKSVLYALSKMGVSSLMYVKRKEDEFIEGYQYITYDNLSGVSGYLLVNATPVGMYPHTGVSPVSDDIISEFDAVADVVYNPAMTEFVRIALRLGKKACSGLYMLVAQAIGSQSIWRDESVCSEDILPIFN